MAHLYRWLRLHLEFECDREHLSGSQRISRYVMETAAIDPEPASTSHSFGHAQNWATSATRPYSPLVCLSLLLAIGLAFEIGF
jgi:hypothetical protein